MVIIFIRLFGAQHKNIGSSAPTVLSADVAVGQYNFKGKFVPYILLFRHTHIIDLPLPLNKS